MLLESPKKVLANFVNDRGLGDRFRQTCLGKAGLAARKMMRGRATVHISWRWETLEESGVVTWGFSKWVFSLCLDNFDKVNSPSPLLLTPHLTTLGGSLIAHLAKVGAHQEALEL